MLERFRSLTHSIVAIGVLPVISFLTGFGLLTFELAAARVLAPSIGSSTYVWTAVIGVIIAALSFGFFIGGRVADRRNRPADVAWLLIAASVTSVLTLMTYQAVLQSIVDSTPDSRLQALLAAFTLFAPTSFLIGTTSPYLAKLNVRSLASTGKAIASLDMFNAIGGIVGTFITGFILFGYIGAHQAIGLVAVLLLIASWLIAPRDRMGRRIVISALVVLSAASPPTDLAGSIKIDTASAHYEVVTGFINDRPVRGLITGPYGTQSAVYTNGFDEPVFWYTGEMSRLTLERQPTSILVLGGGAFTLPQYLSQRLPDARIDVVEIDPKLHDISRTYFGYRDPSNVTEIFTDARSFINQSTAMYDVILVDVYGDTSIPFTFMTREYAQALARRLAPDGIVLANLIGAVNGPCRDSLLAVDAAYRSSLPSVSYVKDPNRASDDRSNFIFAYAAAATTNDGLTPLGPTGVQPYTDNFAPSERLFYECQQAYV